MKPQFVLLSKVQRTKIESKSQLQHVLVCVLLCCYPKYKELRLKANHNQGLQHLYGAVVVIQSTKN